MPEERGLYPRMVLEEQLVFMTAIKSLPRKQALARLGPWLERLGLAD
jgi:ABC-2 type transport system ATP-binding protein